MEEMLSLYDYLGKPAGPELGKQVAQKAAIDKIKYGEKYVETYTYSGKILMYPKTWLDDFFKQTNEKTPTTILYNEPDELPF
jgi:hypothetical protein